MALCSDLNLWEFSSLCQLNYIQVYLDQLNKIIEKVGFVLLNNLSNGCHSTFFPFLYFPFLPCSDFALTRSLEYVKIHL